MNWSELKRQLDCQVHDESEIDFIRIEGKDKTLVIKVHNYGESFSAESNNLKVK
jgi:hypothetical protein